MIEGPVSAEFYVSISSRLHEVTKEIGAIYHGMMSPEEIKLLSGDRVIRHAEVYETARQSKSALPEIPPPIHMGECPTCDSAVMVEMPATPAGIQPISKEGRNTAAWSFWKNSTSGTRAKLSLHHR